MRQLKWKPLLLLGWVMLMIGACGRPAAGPNLPPGPALVMFFTDG